MVLTIDIGNTNTKLAVFNGKQPVKCVTFKAINKQDLEQLLSDFGLFKYSIISSVNSTEESRIETLLNQLGIKTHTLSHNTTLPFTIDYLTPHTLGKDRIAALAGAYAIGGIGNYLVIDCGTCNTYDLLINNHFLGGNIAPGLKMRLDAMHHFTAALPQCSIQDFLNNNENILGKTTQSAIWNGAYWGVINEINGYIERFSQEYPDLKVILTGGLFSLVKDIKSKINVKNTQLIFEPMLVPMGLNFIANNLSKLTNG